jgi:hypothetical protein
MIIDKCDVFSDLVVGCVFDFEKFDFFFVIVIKGHGTR